MNKYRLTPAVMILLLSMFMSSCMSTDNKNPNAVPITSYSSPIDFTSNSHNAYLDTSPVNGIPVFFASVQRMSDRSKELPAALLQASEQASKFVAVKATAKFYSEKMNSSMKYMRDLDVIWDRELALEMIDRLEVSAILQDTYGTYITVKLPDSRINYSNSARRFTGGAPEWTSRIPEIPGFIVSVGISLQTGYVADSFTASDNQALEDLARQISVEVVSGKKLIENSVGTISLQTNFEISEVVIPGFYILDRWRTPDSRYYYSLAITPDLQ
jgi:hypothetical protein